ncbi:hypothetical protein [Psychroserpens sp.]|uniref:hypothetical protein n=1 Tax=Psychroserpens sp. TaxID=2020870 RepID=UPI001AFEAA93|nr:hypothetical protein [Psychroserpens sp.]MBO6607911.1 hypothetical protein [Psychroserpens sp.]MBO6632253.1 hypothetical protein [Psychroserpens sp.]MBO6654962.1 hypothetical protein [Psychroserpens sp.]MBO6682964.1 hypothetical protein [Psychroserpens sp.]MBO6751269.1 hypothetical protein [Psychroserpens sp.]
MSFKTKIHSIEDKLSDFQIVKCRMFHESIALDAQGNPSYKRIGNDQIFDRVSLCDHNIRRKRLGCAHTGANIKFEQLLEALAENHPKYASEILELRDQFNSTISRIYTVDHEMGFLERDLAISSINNDTKEAHRLSQKKEQLVDTHDKLMEELMLLRVEVERFI